LAKLKSANHLWEPVWGDSAFLNKLNRANSGSNRNKKRKSKLPRAKALLSCSALKRICNAVRQSTKEIRCALGRKNNEAAS